MATLAREDGKATVYLVEEITGTRRYVGLDEYNALKALGWPPAKVVPVGTLKVFTKIDGADFLSTDAIAAAVAKALKPAS